MLGIGDKNPAAAKAAASKLGAKAAAPPNAVKAPKEDSPEAGDVLVENVGKVTVFGRKNHRIEPGKQGKLAPGIAKLLSDRNMVKIVSDSK